MQVNISWWSGASSNGASPIFGGFNGNRFGGDGNRTQRNWETDCADEHAELSELEALLSELAGYSGDHQWEGEWYPLTLIADDYFVEAMRELVMDIGDMPRKLPSYLEIDWNATADNLRVDYSSVEFNGTTYWYR